MSKELDAETLRATREGLVESFAEQDRQFGALPEPERYEKFIDPILRKVEVDVADEARRAAADVSEGDKAAASAELEEKARREGWRTEREAVGEFNLATGEQLSGTPVQRKPEGPYTRTARYIFRAIRNAPGLIEWKHRMDKIVLSSHPPEWKAKQYMKVLEDFVRYYGNPLAKKDRKIIVGGK
jgi:post-segregation antitoxin (ccd killing protein)